MYQSPDELSPQLEAINASMEQAASVFQPLIDKVHPSQVSNAHNLLYYLVLRSLDIREMQDHLHAFGLSSLTNAESHIRGQLLEVLQRLGNSFTTPEHLSTYHTSRKAVKEKASGLFGNKDDDSIPYIMVTFHTLFADDYGKVKNLVQSGMNVARINCAHDDESVWFRMIQHVRRASQVTGLPCRIYMDLAGPKIRTLIKAKKKKVKIKEGEFIFLTDKAHNDNRKKTIVCTIDGIAAQLNVGETVLFDDGLIETKVDSIENDLVRLQVLRIASKKPEIKTKKGINFPDSSLSLPAFTKFDRECLPFILKNADIIGFSFVRNAADIDQLKKEMNGATKAIVLKIETPEAVLNLPQLLFRSMEEEHMGVMIARGDLAVEIGFERMSEIQEEILWLCEAAHTPVIWATQVLETLNKSGVATRSEVTDAAHGVMAECVMLNKGTHVIRTLETLKEILQRSGEHRIKKRYTFRPLSIAERFFQQGGMPTEDKR